MWPRVVEVMIGAWLVITPLVFRGTESVAAYAVNAVVSGTIVIVASLAAFWPPAGWARYVTLAVSVWLTLHGYFSAIRPGPPAAQNEIMAGLLLLLFAVLPNHVNQPPHTPARTPRA